MDRPRPISSTARRRLHLRHDRTVTVGFLWPAFAACLRSIVRGPRLLDDPRAVAERDLGTGRLPRRSPWQRRTNVWREVTRPAHIRTALSSRKRAINAQ